MKTVIVRIENRYATALRDDGTFVRVKNQNYSVGQVIFMKNQSVSEKIVWAASAAAAVFILSLGVWAYSTPYTYVSLDVNPSIEYTLNRFDRVLTVKAVNDDGQEIIKEVELGNLSNKTIDEAIAETVKQINEHGYFQGDGAIVIATSAKDIKKAEALANRLKDEVDRETKEQGQDVDIDAISVGRERVNEARELGVTPGRLNLVEKLRDSFDEKDEFDMEEWLQKPVKEIMKATKENREESKEQSKTDKQEQKDQEQSKNQDDKEVKEASKAASKQEKDMSKVESKAAEKKIAAEEKVKKEQANTEEKQTRDKSKSEEKESKDKSKAEEKEIRDKSKVEEKESKDNSKAESKKAKEQAKDNKANNKK